MAEAVRAAAKPGDGFALLIDDFDVIQPGGFALMAHLRAGGEAIAASAGRTKSMLQPEATAASPWLLQA